MSYCAHSQHASYLVTRKRKSKMAPPKKKKKIPKCKKKKFLSQRGKKSAESRGIGAQNCKKFALAAHWTEEPYKSSDRDRRESVLLVLGRQNTGAKKCRKRNGFS